MRELIIKKCTKCNALVKIIEDCNCDHCGITCCNEPMKELKANEIDGAVEKHKPTYEKVGNDLIVNVDHVMDEDHYIEWICLLTNNEEKYVYLKPKEKAQVTFNNVKEGKIYSYCNKHGLWVQDIKE